MAELKLYGTAATVRIKLLKADGSGFAAGGDWTPGAGDVKISKNGGALANVAALPSYTNGRWNFTFTIAEMTAADIDVNIDNGAGIFDSFSIETTGNASAKYIDNLLAATPAVTVTGGKVSINIDEGDVDGDTIVEFLRAAAAVLYGDGTGLNGATKVFDAIDGSKPRVTDAYNSTTGARVITKDVTP